MKYIGIDIGTTMIKGQLIDQNGKICFSSEFLSPKFTKDGISYLSAVKTKEILFDIIKKLANSTKDEIASICCSSLGEAFTLIDKKGNTISDFILFFSDMGEKQKNELKNKISDERIAQISGLSPNRMYSFSKLMWIKENQPEIYAKADKFLMVAQYLVYLLTGKPCCDYSLATRSMCLDIKNKSWSDEIINACGIKKSIFPDLFNCDQIVGNILPDIAKTLNLSKNCKILAGGHDQLMASVGCGLREAGMANDGTGTAECLTTVFDKIPTSMSFYKNNYCVVPYIFPNTYLTYAFLSTGGALLNWHKNYLSPLENKLCKENNLNYFVEVEKAPVKTPTSLLVLPHFAGSGTPYINYESTGAILGLTQETTKEEIFYALMESCCYEMKLNIELLKKEGIIIKKLSTNGGGSKSPIWLKIKASIFNHALTTMSSPEGGIFGTFIIMKHTIENIDYIKIMDTFIKKKSVIKPDKSLTLAYKNIFNKYKKIYPSMMKIWR